MTSFDTLEKSTEDSRPIELYEIVLGSSTFFFTSAEDEITVGANTFIPEPIARGQIGKGADQPSRNLLITMPSSNAFASQYVTIPPGQKATVNIFRLQRDEVPAFNTQLLLFKGVVQSVVFPNDGHSADVAIRSIETALNQNIPRFTFMSMCNHILYDEACGALDTDFDFIDVATSISGDTITITGLGASGIDFVGGYCRPSGTNDFRMVVEQSGDVLTLLLPFAADPTGGQIQAFAGCDHTLLGDCALVFDQVANYGGYPFVPSRNIFATGL